MSPFDILLVIYSGILGVAVLLVVYRMIVGPTILDRAISSDSLVTLVVMGMALYAAHAQAAWAGPAMLGLTGLSFIGTVTFARFVPREDPNQGRDPRYRREPSTDTGPHEAIHPSPRVGTKQVADAANTPANTPDIAPGDELIGMDDPLEDPDHPGEPLERILGSVLGSAGTTAEMETAPFGTEAGTEPETEPEAEPGAGFGTETGFGAQPGSRGFEHERYSRSPETSEEPETSGEPGTSEEGE